MLSNMLVNTQLVWQWSVLFVISVKRGFVMGRNVYQPMPVHVPSVMLFVLNANEVFGNMEAEYIPVHFVTTFFAKMINLNIRYVLF